MKSLPSVRTPSTSNRMSLILRARAAGASRGIGGILAALAGRLWNGQVSECRCDVINHQGRIDPKRRIQRAASGRQPRKCYVFNLLFGSILSRVVLFPYLFEPRYFSSPGVNKSDDGHAFPRCRIDFRSVPDHIPGHPNLGGE